MFVPVDGDDAKGIPTESMEVPFRIIHSPVFSAPDHDFLYSPQFPPSKLDTDLLETRCPSCNAKYSGTHAHFYPCGCSVQITYTQKERGGPVKEILWQASSQGMFTTHPTREGAGRALRDLLGV